MTPEYKKFIEACFEGFDENPVDPEEFIRASERFERIRACFLSGEPLPESEHKLQAVVAEFYKFASLRSAGYIRETDRCLGLLDEFCLDKYRAMRSRLRGSISAATRLEAQAERTYNQLPEAWKW